MVHRKGAGTATVVGSPVPPSNMTTIRPHTHLSQLLDPSAASLHRPPHLRVGAMCLVAIAHLGLDVPSLNDAAETRAIVAAAAFREPWGWQKWWWS